MQTNANLYLYQASRKVKDLAQFSRLEREDKILKAGDGQDGGPSNLVGAFGANLVVQVPTGIRVEDVNRGICLCESLGEGDHIIAAHGGSGGLGNSSMASPTNKAPTIAEKGAQGVKRLLEVKMV